jgi:hypothetical protein
MTTDDLAGMATTLPAAEMPHWNAVIRGILAHAASVGPDLGALLARRPDFRLGQAVRGLSCLLLNRREMVAVAAEAHAAALAGAPATPRETLFAEALGDWLAGQPGRAAARFDAHLLLAPQDALALKMVQAIRFVLGQPVMMRRSVEAALPAWEGHAWQGYMLGCHAFTLEETGDYTRAEAVGRRGVALAPDDAWGLHAVAHVYDMTGRMRDGLDWLSGREAAWAHCNNFRFHVWWHQALLHLDLGEPEAALSLYDAKVRAERTDDYRDIANAASLLMRLELEGIRVGDRWEELAALSEGRCLDGCLAFADLHYMLALVGGGRQAAAARLVARMAATRAAEGEAQAVIAHPGHRAAQGILAFAAGDYPTAWVHLRDAQADMQAVGGSHAQRDVFARLTIEAALRGGYLDAADRLLADRSRQRGGSWDGYAEKRRALIRGARVQAI